LTCDGLTDQDCTSCDSSGSTPYWHRDSSSATKGTCESSAGDNHCRSNYHLTDNGNCVRCHSTCLTCNGLTDQDCTSCDPSSSSVFFHRDDANDANGSCLNSGPSHGNCQNGWYAASEKDCQKCDTTCETCSSSTENSCTSCRSSGATSYWHREDGSDSDGSCQQSGTSHGNCQPGWYAAAEKDCQKCHSSCLSCNGVSTESCTACDDSGSFPFWHRNTMEDTNGTCEASSCRSNYHLTNTNFCTKCHASCPTCSDTTEQGCTSCDTALPYWHRSSQSATHGACNADGNSHGNCQPGFYLVQTHDCQSCHSSCLTCDGVDSQNCTSCNSNGPFPSFHRNNADDTNGTCEAGSASNGQCEAGFYLVESGDCQRCHATCETCLSNAPEDCLSCGLLGQNPYFHHDNAADHKGRCEAAGPSHGNCQTGFYLANTNDCQACDSSCLSCAGPSPEECLSCDSDLPFFHSENTLDLEGECKTHSGKASGCLDGYYLHDASVCHRCHSSCATCSTAATTDCLTCPEGRFFWHIDNQSDTAGECVEEKDNNNGCQEQYFLFDTKVCHHCASSCISCKGADKCTECRAETPFIHYLDVNQQQEGDCHGVEVATNGGCRVGFYLSAQNKCVDCGDKCTTSDTGFCCRNSDLCSNTISSQRCAEVNPPSLQSILLKESSPGISITFATGFVVKNGNQTYGQGSIGCTQVLKSLLKFGESPSCSIAGNGFEILFGPNFSFRLGDTIEVKTGVLYSSDPQAAYGAEFPEEITVGVMNNPPAISYTIDRSADVIYQVKNCEDFDIAISNIVGDYGMEVTILWKVLLKNQQQEEADIPTGTQSLLAASLSTVTLPASAIRDDAEQTIILEIANFASRAQQYMIQLTVSDTKPTLAAVSNVTKTVNYLDSFALSVNDPDYQNVDCYSTNSYRVEWLSSSDFLNDKLSVIKGVTTVNVPAQSLQPKETHTVTAQLVGTSSEFPSPISALTFRITVTPAPTFTLSLTNPPTTTQVKQETTIITIARFENEPAQGNIQYTWSCLQSGEPHCKTLNDEDLTKAWQLSNTGTMTLPSYVLKFGASYDITVSASQDTYQAEQSLTLAVEQGYLPVFEIQSSSPKMSLERVSNFSLLPREGDVGITVLKWSLEKDNNEIASSETANFEVLPSQIVSGQEYTIKIVVENVHGQTNKEKRIFANVKLEGGSVSYSPTSCKEFEDVKFQWSNWENQFRGSLTYAIIYNDINSNARKYSTDKPTLSVLLPSGTITVTTRVEDETGDTFDEVLTINVSSIPNEERATQASTSLDTLESEQTSAVIHVTNRVDVVFLSTVANETGKDTEILPQEREGLIDKMATIIETTSRRDTNPEEIRSLADSIQLLTSKKTYVSQKGRQAMVATVKNILEKDTDLTDTTSATVVTGMSNIIDASQENPSNQSATLGEIDRALDTLWEKMSKKSTPSGTSLQITSKNINLNFQHRNPDQSQYSCTSSHTPTSQSDLPTGCMSVPLHYLTTTASNQCPSGSVPRIVSKSIQKAYNSNKTADLSLSSPVYEHSLALQCINGAMITTSNLDVSNLSEEIIIKITPQSGLSGQNLERQQCYFWDVQGQKWSQEGCKTVETSSSSVTCSCSHLTEFGAGYVIDGGVDGGSSLLGYYVTSSLVGLWLASVVWSHQKERKRLEAVGLDVARQESLNSGKRRKPYNLAKLDVRDENEVEDKPIGLEIDTNLKKGDTRKPMPRRLTRKMTFLKSHLRDEVDDTDDISKRYSRDPSQRYSGGSTGNKLSPKSEDDELLQMKTDPHGTEKTTSARLTATQNADNEAENMVLEDLLDGTNDDSFSGLKRRMNARAIFSHHFLQKATTVQHPSEIAADPSTSENQDQYTLWSYLLNEHMLLSPFLRSSPILIRSSRITIVFTQMIIIFVISGMILSLREEDGMDIIDDLAGWTDDYLWTLCYATVSVFIAYLLSYTLASVHKQEPIDLNQSPTDRAYISDRNNKKIKLGHIATFLIWACSISGCIIYSSEFNDKQSQQWLFTFIVGLLVCFFIFEPVKLFTTALVLKSRSKESEEKQPKVEFV